MPQISKRGGYTPESPIRKLVPYAIEAKNRGIEVYHLNIGQPDIRTPKGALEAVKNADLEVLEYSPSAGFLSYREKICKDYKERYDIELSPEEIIVTNGGSEALQFAMLSCLDQGNGVIIPEPLYANYNGYAQSLGIFVRPITSWIEQGYALPSVEDFEARITDRTEAIIICNPANPTGYMYSREELEKLGEIVKKRDLFLIADEVYRDFCYDGEKHQSILNIPGLENHAIVIDSVSKRFSACGARIGLLASRNTEVLETAMKFAQARLSPSTYGQILGEALLDTPQSYYDEVKEEYKRRRDTVVGRLQAMEGVVCPSPGGAIYCFAQLPIDNADKFCQWMLESFDVDGETVMLAPGTGFYATVGLGKQEVRIAYVLNEDRLNRAMDILEAGLKAYPGRILPKATATVENPQG